MKKRKTIKGDRGIANRFSRRAFLQAAGASVPAISPAYGDVAPKGSVQAPLVEEEIPDKFTPVELSRIFNCSPDDFGPREQAKRLSGYDQQEDLIRTPSGLQSFRGIPFLTGPDGVAKQAAEKLAVFSNPCKGTS